MSTGKLAAEENGAKIKTKSYFAISADFKYDQVCHPQHQTECVPDISGSLSGRFHVLVFSERLQAINRAICKRRKLGARQFTI